jgi:capsular exopolysaccharide synthesis family protein
MDMIEKHDGQLAGAGPIAAKQPVNDIAYLRLPVEPEADSSPSLVMPILRRWYIVLTTFLLMCVIGIPAIWLLIKPKQAVTAAIQVKPVISSILFTDRESEGVLPMYRNFMNTQADLIRSDQVLHRVVDELADKKLKFFENIPDPVARLKNAFVMDDITVNPDRYSELIKITMEAQNTPEAVQIVNAFVNAYMAIEASKETTGGDQKLAVLESERKVLSEKLERQRQTVRQMAEEYGTVALSGREEMMMQRVAALQAELTRIETRKITLQAQVELLQESKTQSIDAERLLTLRHNFVNSDLMVQSLTTNIAQMEQALIVAKQTLAPTNPELQRKADLLETLKQRLEQRRQEVYKNFDEMIEKEMASSDKNQLKNLKAELKQAEAYEKRLQDTLAKENIETIELGRKHLAIQDQQEQLELTKELYDTVRRRIQELEMERKRPARISIAYDANVIPLRNKRIKYTAALILGSLACGMFLAILRDKADHSIHTPEDVTKRIGIRIIGTTVNADFFDTPALPHHVAVADYETICANLGLLDGDGIPNKLVITSAGMRDGKTTFAINLAMSLAKAGKKILLIDGDLRKPDIRRLLNLPKGSRGLQELLFGKSFENSVQSVPSAGFDVLTADSRNMSDAFELLSQSHISKSINSISSRYDHIIIDTPPVLAFPDALLWAKTADGVILTTFAGHTEEKDLKDTLERLAQIKVKVLGTILNSVQAGHSYNRYGYSYYTAGHMTKSPRRKNSSAMLLLPSKEGKKPADNPEP